MGKPLSEEHKKKISEALYKGGPKDEAASPRSAAAQAYLDKFVGKKVEYEDMRSKRDALRASKKSLPKGKMKTAKHKEITAKIKALNAKMKEARQTMAAIKKEASGKKARQNADLKAQKAAYRVTQYDVTIKKAQGLLGSIQDPKRRERVRTQIERAKAGRGKAEKIMREQAKIATGKAEPKKKSAFDFCEHSYTIELAEGKLRLPRTLTFQEQRIDFQQLNNAFDEIQSELEAELAAATHEEMERASQNIQNKLDAGDITAIAALAFLFRGKIKSAFATALRRSYGIGKDAAARELGIGTPSTPLRDTQLLNLDTSENAEAFADAIERTAKGAVSAGIAAGASNSAITSFMRRSVYDEASRGIINLSGTVVGQYVNRGRGSVLFANIARIVAFQRSEVLDSRTCSMCLALDERVVAPDDPAAHMEVVHTHCRGLWVPVFASDEKKPTVEGIPKSIMDNFETVDGRPVVNAFRQLKKPVAGNSKAAQDEVRRRLDKRR